MVLSSKIRLQRYIFFYTYTIVLFNYFKNSYNELVHKVTWPSLEQLIGSTKVVLVASVIFALVVLAMDMAFENIMNGVYNLLR